METYDCNKFPEGSRQRLICEGKSELSLDKTNAYRKIWGLDPLESKEDIEKPRRSKIIRPKNSGIYYKAFNYINKYTKPSNKKFKKPNGEVFIPRVENPLSYIKTTKLIEDTYLLLSILPSDIDLVVGSARSGLIPATTIACALHRPLYTVDIHNISSCGNGWRLREFENTNIRKILLVEDTVYNGTTINTCKNIINNKFPDSDIIRATVYCHGKSIYKTDYYAVELNGNHYLEWNLFNSAMIKDAIFDFDGILCEDILPSHDDDGLLYLNALKNANPKHLVRRIPIECIVTARMEKYRNITLTWLKQHNVNVKELIMGNWSSLSERTPKKVINLKANIFVKSKLNLFVESCPIQAQAINELTGKHVLCPAAAKIFHRT